MEYGTFDVIFDGETVGKLNVEKQGLKIQYTVKADMESKDILRLAAVTRGRYEVIGVMMPVKAGGLELKKAFTQNEARVKALDEAECYVLIRMGDVYMPQEDNRAALKNDMTDDAEPETEEFREAAKWQTCKNPGDLFSDMQLKGALAGLTDALCKREDEDTYVAIPVKEDRPFPDLPVFYYGDEEKIDGKEYLVFHVRGGELKI